jgi:hypothetical protein
VKETELGQIAVEYFSEHPSFDVYQEVPLMGGYVDIVVKIDKFYHCIECKTSLSLEVISQALERKPYCHYVSVFIPSSRGSGGKYLALNLLKQYGIGCYEYNPKHNTVIETLPPKINRRVIDRHLKSTIREEHKTYAQAGSRNVRRYTSFRATVDELVRYVKANPGQPFNVVLGVIKTHYKTMSTARSCLLDYIKTGVIPEVRIELGDHGKILLFPSDGVDSPDVSV